MLVTAALIVAVVLTVKVAVWAVRGSAYVVENFLKGLSGVVSDSVRFVAAVIAAAAYCGLSVGHVVLARWSGANHYGRAFGAECGAAGAALWRASVVHPLRMLSLRSAVDGVASRLPQTIRDAPGPTGPAVPMVSGGSLAGSGPGGVGGVGVGGGGESGGGGGGGVWDGQAESEPSRGHKTPAFEGYTIVGTLRGGGSGGRLYIARPGRFKLAAFERAGFHGVGDVVIKSFSIREGSSLPQIVRESRALEAAKRLGLVLEHALAGERFYYVTRFVPGSALGVVTQRLHAVAGPEGLGPRDLRRAVSYACDLVATLDLYHRAGLWHKDIKPDNIIIDERDGRAHLVDFGLVTPLRSSMTLTTHGTEYFRDPEMVRMALRGVKVHEVDGARFDVYGAGAVLYSVLQNEFPAHGALSRITRRCPEALRWIVRRAMTEYDKRYASAAAMLADLRAVLEHPEIASAEPADLPSLRQGGATEAALLPEQALPQEAPARPAAVRQEEARVPAQAAAGLGGVGAGVGAGVVAQSGGAAQGAGATPRRSAREQLESARARVAARRAGAARRRGGGRARAGNSRALAGSGGGAGGGVPAPRRATGAMVAGGTLAAAGVVAGIITVGTLSAGRRGAGHGSAPVTLAPGGGGVSARGGSSGAGVPGALVSASLTGQAAPSMVYDPPVRALVVRDDTARSLAPGGGPGSQIDTVVSRLALHGILATEADSVEAEASLRRAVGLTPPDSLDGRSAIRLWLISAAPEGVDAVLWFHNAADARSGPAVRVIALEKRGLDGFEGVVRGRLDGHVARQNHTLR
ncbi:MAG: hypothetical protein C0513_07135 [Isosphaera sp.]|nr:hypothetical protein [Isosphaera sp.]